MTLSIRNLVDSLSRGLLGDADASEAARPALGLEMLSRFLPYRIYEPSSRLYLNARSMGFVLNVAPLVGADERTADLLGQFFGQMQIGQADPSIGKVHASGKGVSQRAHLLVNFLLHKMAVLALLSGDRIPRNGVHLRFDFRAVERFDGDRIARHHRHLP